MNKELFDYYWRQALIEWLMENRQKCPYVVWESIKFLIKKNENI